jgi:diguanylate cyclase (GGDEF)-like protein/PAS domain S-box-containing protein
VDRDQATAARDHARVGPEQEPLGAERSWAAADAPAMERLVSAFELAPTGVAVIGMDGRFLRVNRALCTMLGRSAEELVGSTSATFTHPDDLPATESAYVHLRERGTTLTVEKRYVRPDGEVVWAETLGQTVKSADNTACYIVSHFLDKTAVKLAEQRHTQTSHLFETAFADAPIGMALFAPDGRWLKANRALCDLIGYTEAELLALTVQDITHPADIDADLDHMALLLSGEADRYSLEKRYLTAHGGEIWVNLSVSVVRDPDQGGRPLHFIANIEPISERKEMQAALRRLAEHDPLTGLWNRRRFDEELHREAARCKRYGKTSAVLVIDLDGFKAVNDAHGHRAGDELLKVVAAGLRGALRETDSLARIGGDEFAVILPNIAAADVVSVTAKLRRVIVASRIAVGGPTSGVGASIGSQMLDECTRDAQVAKDEADAAMYQVKAAGRPWRQRSASAGGA